MVEFAERHSIILVTLANKAREVWRDLARGNPAEAASRTAVPRLNPATTTQRQAERNVRDRVYVGKWRDMWTLDDAAFEAYGRVGVERMIERMDRLAALAAKHDIVMRVVVYPHPEQIVAEDLDSKQVRIWRDFCAARGLDFLNLFPVFVEPRTWVEKMVFLDRHFIRGDCHWNDAGHARVADAFLSWHAQVSGAR